MLICFLVFYSPDLTDEPSYSCLSLRQFLKHPEGLEPDGTHVTPFIAPFPIFDMCDRVTSGERFTADSAMSQEIEAPPPLRYGKPGSAGPVRSDQVSPGRRCRCQLVSECSPACQRRTTPRLRRPDLSNGCQSRSGADLSVTHQRIGSVPATSALCFERPSRLILTQFSPTVRVSPSLVPLQSRCTSSRPSRASFAPRQLRLIASVPHSSARYGGKLLLSGFSQPPEHAFVTDCVRHRPWRQGRGPGVSMSP